LIPFQDPTVSEYANGPVRVSLNGSYGVTLYVTVGWSVKFEGGIPAAVVLTAIQAAILSGGA
jgi:hypothetical protein